MLKGRTALSSNLDSTKHLTQQSWIQENLTFTLAAFLNILLGFRSALRISRVTQSTNSRAHRQHRVETHRLYPNTYEWKLLNPQVTLGLLKADMSAVLETAQHSDTGIRAAEVMP